MNAQNQPAKPNKTRPTRPRHCGDIAQWDDETDVVVVGFGGAGGCAAIEAADNGAKVMLFELASASGGSTALSSAEIYMGGSGGTRVQKACGFEDSTEAMFTYMMMCAGPQADEAKIRNYCESSAAHFDWLVELGVPFKDSFHETRAIMCLTDDCLLYTGSEKAWPFKEHAA
ncbi:MAG: FAD-binding protein, partial [Pseudomonadota bacterium]